MIVREIKKICRKEGATSQPEGDSGVPDVLPEGEPAA